MIWINWSKTAHTQKSFASMVEAISSSPKGTWWAVVTPCGYDDTAPAQKGGLDRDTTFKALWAANSAVFADEQNELLRVERVDPLDLERCDECQGMFPDWEGSGGPFGDHKKNYCRGCFPDVQQEWERSHGEGSWYGDTLCALCGKMFPESMMRTFLAEGDHCPHCHQQRLDELAAE